MENQIDLNAIYTEIEKSSEFGMTRSKQKEFAKEACRRVLYLAAERAKVRTISEVTGDPVTMTDWESRLYKVDGKSIIDIINYIK